MEKTTSFKYNVITDRIQVVDALRGFALFGIILAHITHQYLAGPTPTSMEGFNIFSPLDKIMGAVAGMLTFGKFFTIFSFLFGLSFAIQLQNANEKKKKGFILIFMWRLIILFAIGFVHSLFYSGDILRTYALLGFFLILFRKVSNWVLLVLAMLLILNTPIFIARTTALFAPPPTTEQIEMGKKQSEFFNQMAEKAFKIKQSGTLAEIVKMNFEDGMTGTLMFQLMTGRLFVTFGLFLLGLYVGRKRLFVDKLENRAFFRKLLIWSGGIALVSTTILLIFDPFLTWIFNSAGVNKWLAWMVINAFDIHQISLSLFYVAAITLCYWHYQPKLLQWWAAVGQTGLTTYLIQSVFGVILFLGMGWGLMGKIGVTFSITLGILIFAFQTFFAVWWLRKFHYGFFEWLWRSLTYLKIQPLVRK